MGSANRRYRGLGLSRAFVEDGQIVMGVASRAGRARGIGRQRAAFTPAHVGHTPGGDELTKHAATCDYPKCAVLGLNQSRLAKRLCPNLLSPNLCGRLDAVDLLSAMRPVFAPDRTVRYVATGGNCP